MGTCRRRICGQQVFGLGINRTGRLPRPWVQWRRAPPVTLTAARQSRIRTGFPGSWLSLTGITTVAPTAGVAGDGLWHHVAVTERTRRDLCPGLLRPWIADDGALVRVRVPGGIVPTAALCALVEVARAHGDGAVHLTSRANLQVRGLEHDGGRLPETVVADVIATGLVPSTSHELVRNILASPLTGRSGGRADLHPVVAGLDARLRAEPRLTALTGRFLFVLDDGRGDLVSRDLDLGLVALDSDTAQLRAGTSAWGPVIRLDEAAAALTGLAVRFAGLAGDRPDSPWHVDELPGAGAALLGTVLDRAERTRVSTPPPALGRIVQDDGRVTAHLAAPGGRVDAPLLEEIRALGAGEIVVTPYRTLLVPDLENA